VLVLLLVSGSLNNSCANKMVISGALLVADILVVHSSARDQDINLQSVWFGKQKLVFVLLSVK